MDGFATGLSTCLTKDGQTTPTANIPMGGFKVTGLGNGASAQDAATYGQLTTFAPLFGICEFRLSLTSGVPVTTSDVTAAGTIYLSPYKGNRISLYDGANWNVRTSSEIATGGVAGGLANTNYDVFCYDNATVPTLEFSPWASDSARAIALVLQNGILVKSGAPTRRYLGTLRLTAAQLYEDSYTNRTLWNYYNRAYRPLRRTDPLDTWNYTTATWRIAGGNTSNQVNFVIGWSEDAVTAQVHAFSKNTNTLVNMIAGIGYDATNALASGCLTGGGMSALANSYVGQDAHYTTIPAVGYHFLAWIELSDATGTTTWAGDGGAPASTQSGIQGWVWA